MYFNTGNYTMGGNFRVLKQAPMDDRATVSKLADLTNPNIFNGFTYNGMSVSVTEDGVNNGIYRLEDKNTLTWKKEGSDVNFTEALRDKLMKVSDNNRGAIVNEGALSSITDPMEGDFVLNRDTLTFWAYENGVWVDTHSSTTAGSDGLSAYELDVLTNGYSGTLEQWLIDLKGEPGTNFEYKDFLEDFSINGKHFDENNNIELDGISMLSSPKLNVEKLTEYRHPISGKPLYSKVVNWGTLPNAAVDTKTFSMLGIPDELDTILFDFQNSYMVHPSNSYTMPLFYSHEIGDISVYCNHATKSIMLNANKTNRTGYTGYLCVLYTKTTDTSTSPVKLVGPQIADIVANTPINQIVENIKINGQPMDSFGNIQIEGTSTMSSPEVNIEKLTEYRHPVSCKPIYTKTIDFGAMPNNSTKLVETGLEANGVTIIESAVISPNESFISLNANMSNLSYSAPTNQWQFYISSGTTTKIACATWSDRTALSAFITIRYTKTTDTALSPVKLVGTPTPKEVYDQLSFNGVKPDEYGNVELEGVSTLVSPELNVEKLTEYRHPVTKKPIYSKTIHWGVLPNNAASSKSLEVLGLDTTMDWCSYSKDSSYVYRTSDPKNIYPIPMSHINYIYIVLNLTSKLINVTTAGDWSVCSMYLTFIYTKTTDNASSPVRLIAGIGDSAYDIWLQDPSNAGKTVEEYRASMKGARGLPGPKDQDGSVSFNDLTEEQVEELTRNKYVRVRESNNFLYYNKNNNTAYLDIAPSQNLRIESIKVKTVEDVEYDVPATQIIGEPNEIGEYRYINIDHKTDIFDDGSCVAFFPLTSDVKSQDDKYSFLLADSAQTTPVFSNQTLFGATKNVLDTNTKRVSLRSDNIYPVLPENGSLSLSLFVKVANISSTYKYIISSRNFTLYIHESYIYITNTENTDYSWSPINTIAANTWYHIVVNVKGNVLSSDVYVNGTKINFTRKNRISTGYTPANVRLCATGDYLSNESLMQITSFRIFNKHLTAGEISTLRGGIIRGVMEFHHGSGKELKEAKMVNTTINLPIPKATNEAGAKALGL